MTIVLPTSLKYCCYTTLWNAEVIVWPFTAMHLYWVLGVAHAWAQKTIVRQQNHCKSVTYLTTSLSYQDLVCRQTKTTPHQRVGHSDGVTWLLTVPLESGVLASTRLRSCWRRIYWALAEIKIVWCDTYGSDYFERQLSVMFVAIRLIIQMHT